MNASTTTVGRGGRLRTIHEKFIVEDRVVPAAVRTRLFSISAALVVVGIAGFIVALVSVLNDGGITVIDEPIRAWLMEGRSESWTPAMLVVSFVFGPLFFPFFALAITIVFFIRARHLWRPILLALGTVTGVVSVRFIAEAVGRDRPPVEQMLTEIDSSESFPSGHVIGATLFILLIAYLVFSRRQAKKRAIASFVVAAVMVVVTAVSRLYLGYHWATDAIGAIFLALVVLGIVIAIDTRRTTRAAG